MKKICLILGLLCIPTFANAATVLYLGNSGNNLGNVVPGADLGGSYFKCSNGGTWSGCESSAIQITYDAITGGTGASNNPYILTNCAFIGCACSSKEYLSGKKCISCATGYYGNSTLTGNSQYHRSSSCNYCAADYYRSGTTCSKCPGNGTKPGVNADGITSCCLDLNASQSDTSGTYTCTSKMCYAS